MPTHLNERVDQFMSEVSVGQDEISYRYNDLKQIMWIGIIGELPRMGELLAQKEDLDSFLREMIAEYSTAFAIDAAVDAVVEGVRSGSLAGAGVGFGKSVLENVGGLVAEGAAGVLDDGLGEMSSELGDQASELAEDTRSANEERQAVEAEIAAIERKAFTAMESQINMRAAAYGGRLGQVAAAGFGKSSKPKALTMKGLAKKSARQIASRVGGTTGKRINQALTAQGKSARIVRRIKKFTPTRDSMYNLDAWGSSIKKGAIKGVAKYVGDKAGDWLADQLAPYVSKATSGLFLEKFAKYINRKVGQRISKYGGDFIEATFEEQIAQLLENLQFWEDKDKYM